METGRDNQWDDSPFTEYKIVTHGRNSQSKTGTPATYVFEVTFKPEAKEAKIGLWHAMIDDKNIMELNIICPEKYVYTINSMFQSVCLAVTLLIELLD